MCLGHILWIKVLSPKCRDILRPKTVYRPSHVIVITSDIAKADKNIDFILFRGD